MEWIMEFVTYSSHQGGKSRTLASGYMGQQILWGCMGRRWWSCHVSCISTNKSM